MKNAFVLASGGMDSVVLTHYLQKMKGIGKIKVAFIDYGQKCLEEELHCVKKLAEEVGAELKVINMKWLGDISTSLINKKASEDEIEKIKEEDEIISWYVPCRNAIFLLAGLAVAESEFISKKEVYDVYLGIKFEGERQFKDTTPEFLEEMNKLIGFCTQENKFKFVAPFLEKDKEEVIGIAKELGVTLEDTYSCYIGGGFEEKNGLKIPAHCGVCGGCKSRKKAFRFSDTKDTSIYKN